MKRFYGTRPWRSFGEGPTKAAEGAFHEAEIKYTPQDFRFTTKGETLYAIEMAPPEKGEVVIHSLGLVPGEQRVDSVALLGSSAAVAIEQGADGLHLKLSEPPAGKFAVVYRIQFSGR